MCFSLGDASVSAERIAKDIVPGKRYCSRDGDTYSLFLEDNFFFHPIVQLLSSWGAVAEGSGGLLPREALFFDFRSSFISVRVIGNMLSLRLRVPASKRSRITSLFLPLIGLPGLWPKVSLKLLLSYCLSLAFP